VLSRRGERIRILRVIARLNIGGPALHVVHLNAGLRAFDSLLATGGEGPREGSMRDMATARGLRVETFPELGREIHPARDLAATWKLLRIMRREKPHIVHTHTAKAGFTGRIAARLAGAPVVCHTFHGHVLRGYFSPARSALFTLMERFCARLSDRLIVPSPLLKEELVELGVSRPERITVMPLGLELDRFARAAEGRRGGFRAEIGALPGQKLVGVVGRLVKIKNLGLFIDAARIVHGQDPGVRFALVGDGDEREALERRARAAGMGDYMHFTGWRRDLERVYPDLDAVALSSDNEGTPVSLIEAMAAGRQVVATRVGGVPDILEHGRLGRLIPPGIAEALARGITEALHAPEEERLRTTREAQAVALARYSADRLVADMERLYVELLRAKGVIA
jgi:glycosyltransferase involved in cell wall biosynthesis